MLRSKLFLTALPLALAAATASAQSPQAAQAAPAAQAPKAGVAVGAKVSDPKGGEVGTVSKLDGQFAILKTDKHEVRLPVTSFTAHNGGLLVAMTRDELNAAVEKTLAEANQKITVGASVTGSQGGNVGTIDALDDQFVTVKLTSGKLVRLPRAAIAPGPNGGVIGMTVAELEAAAAAAAAPKAE
jgi:preprotein translocase subunit YajC